MLCNAAAFGAFASPPITVTTAVPTRPLVQHTRMADEVDVREYCGVVIYNLVRNRVFCRNGIMARKAENT